MLGFGVEGLGLGGLGFWAYLGVAAPDLFSVSYLTQAICDARPMSPG